MILATWFGTGLSPLIPGTTGTAGALPFALLVSIAADRFIGMPAGWNWANLAAAALLFMPGVIASGRIETYTGKHDPGMVVIDEVVGLLLTMAFLPAVSHYYAGSYIWAFFVFRLLDIWKPGLIGLSQNLPRGWGVMVDDVLAGLLGGVGLWVIARFFPEWINWGDLSPWVNRLIEIVGG